MRQKGGGLDRQKDLGRKIHVLDDLGQDRQVVVVEGLLR